MYTHTVKIVMNKYIYEVNTTSMRGTVLGSRNTEMIKKTRFDQEAENKDGE